jgi:hypothetical protein
MKEEFDKVEPVIGLDRANFMDEVARKLRRRHCAPICAIWIVGKPVYS